jgi:glycosyltransferase involved in cell wall biosynthesis
MKILHVDTGKSWRGGQQQVLYLHRELTAEGVDSHLICSRGGELEKRARAIGLTVEGLPLRGEWDIFSALAISRRIKALGITHLHLHSSHAQMLGAMASVFSGLKNVIATRRVDFIPSRHLINRWKYGPPIARHVAISKAIRQILIDFGIDPKDIRLVNSGVDPERVTPGEGKLFREEFGVAPDEKLVGNIGHLTEHKGQSYFIDAMPAILENNPNTRFAIIGEGELEEELKARAKALGLEDRLIFTGFRNDIDKVMDALDVFVMSSTMEGLGTIVADALAAQRPLVATLAGGIPEIVDDGVDGLLVPARDSAAIAEGVNRLLGDEALAARLGAAGREKVLKQFSARAMALGNLNIYKELEQVGP